MSVTQCVIEISNVLRRNDMLYEETTCSTLFPESCRLSGNRVVCQEINTEKKSDDIMIIKLFVSSFVG